MGETVLVPTFLDGFQVTLELHGVRAVVFRHDNRLMLHTVDPIDGAYVIREAPLESQVSEANARCWALEEMQQATALARLSSRTLPRVTAPTPVARPHVHRRSEARFAVDRASNPNSDAGWPSNMGIRHPEMPAIRESPARGSPTGGHRAHPQAGS
jgi:hypothetical protein